MRDAQQAEQANCHVFAYLSSVLQPFFLHPVKLASETATSPATRQGMFFSKSEPSFRNGLQVFSVRALSVSRCSREKRVSVNPLVVIRDLLRGRDGKLSNCRVGRGSLDCNIFLIPAVWLIRDSPCQPPLFKQFFQLRSKILDVFQAKMFQYFSTISWL